MACRGEKRNGYGVLVGKIEERNCLEDLGVDGRTMLKIALI